MKNTVKAILCSNKIASMLINPVLQVHNLSYYLAGLMSQSLEPYGLHPKHRIMDYHLWFSSRLKPDWTILDVGCGNGALARDLIKHCKHIIAIDIDPCKIKEAKDLNTEKNIEFIVGDATAYPFEKKFDAVVLSNVLEHIKDRIRFLRDLSQYSDIFLIRVPMIDRDWITLYKQERDIPYLLDSDHYIEYTFDSFSKEVNTAGLKITENRVRYGELYAVCIRS
ncbi:class I SAM-dependent methyltransferase [Thermodesulfobacteriota bacterium]